MWIEIQWEKSWDFFKGIALIKDKTNSIGGDKLQPYFDEQRVLNLKYIEE